MLRKITFGHRLKINGYSQMLSEISKTEVSYCKKVELCLLGKRKLSFRWKHCALKYYESPLPVRPFERGGDLRP